jgi:hypothetical protein
MRLLTALVCLCFLSSPALGSIGKIATQTGPDSTIQRQKNTLTGGVNTAIESNDTVTTRKGTTTFINFNDDTKVKITENSRLVIDDFVYDPNRSDAGRLAMKVSMGTVRYASGQIAKVNPQRINIKTPSASIAVRGTDFHMTVDEMGKSLIVLVPSCRDENETLTKTDDILLNCQTGSIVVENNAGTVELNQPFQATFIENLDELPLPPVMLNLTITDPRISFDSQVNNNLIISQPEVIKEQVAQTAKEQEQEEEQEEDTVTRTAAATANTKDKDDTLQIVAVTTSTDNAETCSDKIICVEMNPYVTFYRETDGNYAEVRARLNSNVNLTITHNGDQGKVGWGASPENGNKITIRQSQ